MCDNCAAAAAETGVPITVGTRGGGGLNKICLLDRLLSVPNHFPSFSVLSGFRAQEEFKLLGALCQGPWGAG